MMILLDRNFVISTINETHEEANNRQPKYLTQQVNEKTRVDDKNMKKEMNTHICVEEINLLKKKKKKAQIWGEGTME